MAVFPQYFLGELEVCRNLQESPMMKGIGDAFVASVRALFVDWLVLFALVVFSNDGTGRLCTSSIIPTFAATTPMP